ncbi:MAG: fructose-bisphosphate aldolase [Deltaproteobacteria bacterium]|nr:fructose-bisphosphate aldolase [Deltaproteobacteria bacterium]MBW1960656.1 fructose-bisphosphate aldolase [Deltaproteobacteria bacterium]MBW1995693.1 fructose-bisphosphate aldolase [Deltaproteobacteria bacterium]MBW2152046.1 fructose-bisphosphate aldolase [Deltaproteobacteria bacterium]
MTSLGKKVRLTRILNLKSKKLFIVTVDHPITRGMFPGLVNMENTLEAIVQGGPDALLMHKGIADRFFPPHAGKIPLILKASSFSPFHPTYDTWVTYADEAVRFGADAISMGVILGSEKQAEMLRNLGLLSRDAARYGLVLMAHMYPAGELIKDEERYSVEKLTYCVRAGEELGVDVIKTWYTGDPDTFARVVEVAPGKVVAAGGPKTETDEQLFQMTRNVMDAGALGVAFGRNVWGHRDPAGVIRALKAIIHENRSVSEALEILK